MTILVLVIVVFGLLLAAGVTGIVLHVRKSAARTEELRRLAPSLGLTPMAPETVIRGEQPGEAAIWDAAGGAFGLASRGIVDNLFRGERDGREVWLFDFSYSRTPGPGGTRMRATVVSLALPEPLPSFRMTPEGRLDKVVASLGGQDIDFESAPEFSRRYHLQAPDETAIRTLFSPAVLDFFAAHQGLNLAAVEDRLVVHSPAAPDGRLPARDIAALLDRTSEIAARLRA